MNFEYKNIESIISISFFFASHREAKNEIVTKCVETNKPRTFTFEA